MATDTKAQEGRRRQVKRACSNCRTAHAGCDSQRPCSRCIKKSLVDSCEDWRGDKPLGYTNASIPTTSLKHNYSPHAHIGNLPLKRSRDQICNHGWENSEDSFLNNMLHFDGLDNVESIDSMTFPYSPPTPTIPELIEGLPLLGECLPPHKIQYNQPNISHKPTTWYRFVQPPQSEIVATSFWLVKKTGRSDCWTLLECNQGFIDLIQKKSETLSSQTTMLDLVPQRFQSSTKELLQQIIQSDPSSSEVATATAKSIWKKNTTETCINTRYSIMKISDPSSVHLRNPHKKRNTLSLWTPELRREEIHECNHFSSPNTPCESTGCGAFRNDWKEQQQQQQQFNNKLTSPCSDDARIDNVERENDLIITAVHNEVQSYDDYVQIGNTIHEKTFSIQVSAILQVTSSASAAITPKGKKMCCG